MGTGELLVLLRHMLFPSGSNWTPYPFSSVLLATSLPQGQEYCTDHPFGSVAWHIVGPQLCVWLQPKLLSWSLTDS